MLRTRDVAAAILVLVAISCREGVGPFIPDERTPSDAALLRLTYNAGDERDPQWSADGDVIYFHSDDWHALPGYSGALLQVPAAGGIATRLTPAAQPTSAARLTLPVTSPDGERIAYLHLRLVRAPLPNCMDGEFVCPIATALLDTGAVKVRAIDAATSTFSDPAVAVPYRGDSPSLDSAAVDSLFPFQTDYGDGNELTNLRPSWAPDGERLVLSDGLRLLLWELGTSVPVEIPNTADGVAPAWSPDGEWIAFGILQRGAERAVVCNCGANTAFPVQRVDWELTARLIAIVRPDGSDLQVLGEGAEPAWSPDGTALYFRRGDEGLFRLELATGAVTPIADTEGARSPAVSPAGDAIAFARRDAPRGDFNIWRMRLQP